MQKRFATRYADILVGNIKMTQEHKAWYSRGYHPHFDSLDVIQTINFRLADSLPTIELKRLQQEMTLKPDSERLEYIEACLDKGHGECYLNNPRIAQVVEGALLFFDNQRYHLVAWVIMPNHVHVMAEMFDKYPIAGVVKSWKGFTAREANKILGRSGEFWERDYFDRFVRNEEHYYNAMSYIHMNPVKAGLVEKPEDWPFSSARFIAG
jgi:REP element-mobilizing transposase RayT